MFSFLTGLLTLLRAGKVRSDKRAARLKKQRNHYKKLLNSEEPESSTDDSGSTKSIKTYLLGLLTAVIAFFETLPLFLALLYGFLITICIVAIIAVGLLTFAFLANLPLKELPLFDPTEVESPQGGNLAVGSLNWTESELAARGMLLTDYEKNLYRMGILAKKSVEGYGGGELMVTPLNAPKEMRMLFLMGVSSTETSMRFFNDPNRQDNILEYPSDIPQNELGFGFMGLHKDKTLEDYFPNSPVQQNIKSEYTPKDKPLYLVRFAPYAVAMSAKHHTGDLNGESGSKSTLNKINTIADAWGIYANRTEFINVVMLFLAQAKYHGAESFNADGGNIDEFNGYINFYAALFAATSDKDAERTFTRWSYSIPDGQTAGGLSESAIRPSIVGNNGSGAKNMLDDVSTPAELPYKAGKTLILLNGQSINNTLWGFLWSKYSDKPGMQLAWKVAQQYSAKSGYISDRVLNFHYGFNSYMQGLKIKKILEQKMLAGFQVTPGQGQANLNGKTTLEFIESWYANASASEKAFVDRLKPHWGKSVFLQHPSKSLGANGGYKDDIFGVPFYEQTSRSKTEDYGDIVYTPDGNNTFNQSGCMIYSHAYAISAFTGRLVNPAELAVIMVSQGALKNDLIYRDAMVKNVYPLFGLRTEAVNFEQAPFTDAHFNKIREGVKQGGIAIVRFKNGPFTSRNGENHFVALTGIEEKGGKEYYTMYSSSSVADSKTAFTPEEFVPWLWKDVTLVYKN